MKLNLEEVLVTFIILSIGSVSCAYVEASLRHYESIVPGQTKHVNFDKMRVKKINKTHHAFLGDLEVFQEFGDEYKISGLIYKMAGNEYRQMPYKLGPDGWCEFIKKAKSIYAEFLPVSNFPPAENVRFSINFNFKMSIFSVSMGEKSLHAVWVHCRTSKYPTISRIWRLSISTKCSPQR